MRTLILASLLLLPAAASCIAVAAVGAGVLVGQQVIEDNVYVGQINVDSNRTWAQTKTTLSHASLAPIDVDNERRRAIADIDGASVTVTVETYDLNKSQIKVSAKRYGFAASETARTVFERIIEDLNRSTSSNG